MKYILQLFCLGLSAMINVLSMVSYDVSHWQALALQVDPRIEVLASGRSVYFLGDLFARRETCAACISFDLLTITDPAEFAQCKRALVDEYKIHLMLDPAFMDQALIALLSHMRDDRDFARLLQQMKIIMETPSVESGKLLPMIVLYPFSGKEMAQQLAERLITILADIPPLSIEHIPLNMQRFLAYPEGAALCPRANLLFYQGSGPLICYAQGEGAFKEEMIMAVNFVGDSFTTPVYRQPGITSGISLYRRNDLAVMLGYRFGVYLTHDQFVILQEAFPYRFFPKVRPGAFVFHRYKDLSRMTLRELGNELSVQSVLSADEITGLRQQMERKLAECDSDLSRSIYLTGIKSLDNSQDQRLLHIQTINADAMAKELTALLQRPVMGPLSFGDLFYDQRENKALYPPDFLDDVAHDFHLKARVF